MSDVQNIGGEAMAVLSSAWLDSDSAKAAASGDAVASQRRHGCDDSSKTYKTVVADPPWEYKGGFNGWGKRDGLPYAHMTLDDIKALAVAPLIEREGYLFLWTTNRWLERAFELVRAWGCTPRQTLTWCKPKGQKGLGGMFATTTEFVIVGQKIREGTNAHGARTNQEREGSSWFEWPRQEHSAKPEAFQDMVERVAPGPYLELFARRKRLGWHAWGNEVESDLAIPAVAGLAPTVGRDVRGSRNTTAQESNARISCDLNNQ